MLTIEVICSAATNNTDHLLRVLGGALHQMSFDPGKSTSLEVISDHKLFNCTVKIIEE